MKTSRRWCAIGIFQGIGIENVPGHYNSLGILLRIECDPHEVGEHELAIDYVDGHGSRAGQIPPVQFTIPPTRDGGVTPGVYCGVTVNQLAISAIGNYDFVVRVDGRIIGTVPLYIRQLVRQGGGER